MRSHNCWRYVRARLLGILAGRKKYMMICNSNAGEEESGLYSTSDSVSLCSCSNDASAVVGVDLDIGKGKCTRTAGVQLYDLTTSCGQPVDLRCGQGWKRKAGVSCRKISWTPHKNENKRWLRECAAGSDEFLRRGKIPVMQL
ncbi:unnamed protein product [Amoebophrya sp. A25]|nr:unnamed protein product [Amoebophrya sp. A25]|eukprot:GSA25T00017313001.1